jgi:hypothetical protein
LVFDRKGNRDWPLEKCQKAFAVFRRWLEYNFPDCWFIFVMEWTRKCGIHYHLTGRFGKKDIPKDVIREKWMKITGSTWSKSIKFLPSLPHLRGYLTTSKKAADTRHLMKELQGKSFWGCIHRKKIPLVPTKRLTFTDDGAFIYKLSLAFQIIIEGGSKNDIRRIFKKNGSLAFTTPEMRKKSLQFAQVYMEVMS